MIKRLFSHPILIPVSLFACVVTWQNLMRLGITCPLATMIQRTLKICNNFWVCFKTLARNNRAIEIKKRLLVHMCSYPGERMESMLRKDGERIPERAKLGEKLSCVAITACGDSSCCSAEKKGRLNNGMGDK